MEWGQFEDIEDNELGQAEKSSKQANQKSDSENPPKNSTRELNGEEIKTATEITNEDFQKEVQQEGTKAVNKNARGEIDFLSATRKVDVMNKIGSDEALSLITSTPSCPDFGSLEAAHMRIMSSGLTFSEAKGEIWKLRKSGNLVKRGFRHRKLWVERYVLLSGRMLKYYERKAPEENLRERGVLELTKNTVVEIVKDTPEYRFGFNVIPDGASYKGEYQEIKPAASRTTRQPRRHLKKPSTSWGFTGWFGGGCTSSDSVRGFDSPGRHASRQIREHSNSGSQVDQIPIDMRVFSANDLQSHSQIRTFGSQHSGRARNRMHSTTSVNPPLQGGASRTVPRRSLHSDRSSWVSSESQIWRFKAKSDQERKQWVAKIERSIALIKRVEVGPTLAGVGRVHDHYQLLGVIGKGRFGYVKEAVANKTGQKYAIKVVNKTKYVTTEEQAIKLRNEIRILRRVTRKLHCTHICKLFHAYEDEFMVYLVLERLSGMDLLDGILIGREVKDYSEEAVANIIRQIVYALSELHGVGIMLCDLKAETLMFTDTSSQRVVKVVDFGSAMILPPASTRAQMKGGRKPGGAATVTLPLSFRHDFITRQPPLIGTPGNMAPEIIAENKYSPACDIFSLGCIMYTLLVGYPPFIGRTKGEIIANTMKGFKIEKEDWKGVSMPARKLVGSLLNQDRSKRPTANEILAHDWLMNPAETSLPSAANRILQLNNQRQVKHHNIQYEDGYHYGDKRKENLFSEQKEAKRYEERNGLQNVKMNSVQKSTSHINESRKTEQIEEKVGIEAADTDKDLKQLAPPPTVSLLEEITREGDFPSDTRSHLLLDVKAERVRAEKTRALSIDYEGDDLLADTCINSDWDSAARLSDAFHIGPPPEDMSYIGGDMESSNPDEGNVGSYKSARHSSVRDPGRFLCLLEQKLQQAADIQDP